MTKRTRTVKVGALIIRVQNVPDEIAQEDLEEWVISEVMIRQISKAKQEIMQKYKYAG